MGRHLSGDAEIFGWKAEKIAQFADVDRIERFVTTESRVLEARKIYVPAKFVLDLLYELP